MAASKLEILDQLKLIRLKKDEIVKSEKYEFASRLRDEEKRLLVQLQEMDYSLEDGDINKS